MPKIDRITVYPIKSFDGSDVESCDVLTNGALLADRQYALVDGWGKYVSGKSCPAIHRVRAEYCNDLRRVELSCDGQRDSFELAAEQQRIAEWCSEFLQTKCRMIENQDGGFPDDCESPGPTLVTTATLQAVSEWLESLDLEETRRRFRFNFEVSDAPAFWEDSLVPEHQKLRRFHVGDVVWQGNGVCKRCIVPTRDSRDGSVTSEFVREFVRQRESQLPGWAPRSRFDSFYRLGVNTRIESDARDAVVRVGDTVALVD